MIPNPFASSQPSLWPGGFLNPLAVPLVFDASVREEHGGQWAVTSYAVETGQQITDHVQPQPVGLTVDIALASSPDAFVLPKANRAQNLLSQLVDVFDTRQPFDYFTTLKLYTSMVATSWATSRTAASGDALVVTVVMRKIETITVDQAQVLADAAVAMSLAGQDLGNVSPDASQAVGQAPPVV